MAWAKGTSGRILIDSETTYKSDPASPDGKILPFVRESLVSKRNLIDSVTITGDRNKKRPGQGNVDVSGDIEIELSETPYATLMRHLLGSNATTGASDPYTHTIKIGALPVGLVIENGFTDIAQYFKYNGCRVAGATFRFPKEGLCTATFRIMGAKETVGTSSYDATPTSMIHTPFSAFEATILEGGSSIATVTDVEFSIDNDLDADGFTLGGAGERKYLPEGFAICTGTLTALFEDVALYTKAKNLTETSLKITVSHGTTPARSVEFLIPELVYEQNAPAIEGPKGVTIKLPFRSYYDNSTEATSLQVIIMNGLATI